MWQGQIKTGFVNCAKIFGLNHEGNGILSRHLWVRFAFQQKKGWSQASLNVDKTVKMLVPCPRGEAGVSRLERPGVSQGQSESPVPHSQALLLWAHLASTVAQTTISVKGRFENRKKIIRNAHGYLNIG